MLRWCPTRSWWTTRMRPPWRPGRRLRGRLHLGGTGATWEALDLWSFRLVVLKRRRGRWRGSDAADLGARRRPPPQEPFFELADQRLGPEGDRRDDEHGG